MKYAVCACENGELECVLVRNVYAVDDYKQIIGKAIEQIRRDNKRRKNPYRIERFIFLADCNNHLGPARFSVWENEMKKQAEGYSGAVYDFKVKHGIEY